MNEEIKCFNVLSFKNQVTTTSIEYLPCNLRKTKLTVQWIYTLFIQLHTESCMDFVPRNIVNHKDIANFNLFANLDFLATGWPLSITATENVDKA